MIHYWRTYPESADFPAEKILEQFLKVSRAFAPAITSAIKNHIETKMPSSSTGNCILPELAAKHPDRAKAVFLYEENHKQIVNNFLHREPTAGEQHGRAKVTILFGRWLHAECGRLGLTALPSRPLDTLIERIIGTLLQ